MNYKLLYYLKKNRGKGGKATIYLRITVDGIRREISTKRQINAKEWDCNGMRVRGNTEFAREINFFLENFRLKIGQEYNNLYCTGTSHISASLIKNAVTGKKKKKNMFLPFFDEQIKLKAKNIGKGEKEYAEGTIRHYRTAYNKFADFLQYEYDLHDIPIEELKYNHIEDFQTYLLLTAELKNKPLHKMVYGTAKGYLKKLKTIVNIAFKRNLINKNPFAEFKFESDDDSKRTFLTIDELQIIESKEFKNDRIGIIKDLFIFACYTGLSYSDIFKLSEKEIVSENGKKKIVLFRTKTGVRSVIPLLPKALEILNKYSSYPENLYTGSLLPQRSNSKFNEYLHEIQQICGLSKELTTHVGRHTFATTVTLTKGISMESVSKMLGHKSIRTTQIYAKVVDIKVENEMEAMINRLQNESSAADTGTLCLN